MKSKYMVLTYNKTTEFMKVQQTKQKQINENKKGHIHQHHSIKGTLIPGQFCVLYS